MSKDKLTELVESIDVVDNKIADLKSELEIWQQIRRTLTGEDDWTEEELMRPVL